MSWLGVDDLGCFAHHGKPFHFHVTLLILLFYLPVQHAASEIGSSIRSHGIPFPPKTAPTSRDACPSESYIFICVIKVCNE